MGEKSEKIGEVNLNFEINRSMVSISEYAEGMNLVVDRVYDNTCQAMLQSKKIDEMIVEEMSVIADGLIENMNARTFLITNNNLIRIIEDSKVAHINWIEN